MSLSPQSIAPQNLTPQAIHPATTTTAAAPEKFLIAFVIQGEDVFKITADNVVHTVGTANGPAFDAIAKLKAAAALLELTNRHKERPDELRQMARELAGEGMKLMARASSAIRPVPATPESASASASESISEPLLEDAGESVAPAQSAAPVVNPRADLFAAPIAVPVPAPLPQMSFPEPAMAPISVPMSATVSVPAPTATETATNSRIALISG